MNNNSRYFSNGAQNLLHALWRWRQESPSISSRWGAFSFLYRVCLCWGLTSQSTIFQSCRDGATASWVINQYFQGVKCLAQGHNTAEVGFVPPTSSSRVRHSTTVPRRSPLNLVSTPEFFPLITLHESIKIETRFDHRISFLSITSTIKLYMDSALTFMSSTLFHNWPTRHDLSCWQGHKTS